MRRSLYVLFVLFLLSPGPRPAPGQVQTLVVLPVGPVAVAPGQPPVGSDEAATPDAEGVKTGSPTAGIVNALCDVTLNIVGCLFLPNEVTLLCDTDADGVPELTIPLTSITPVNRLLVQATLKPRADQLPGTAFPLACCGRIAVLELVRAFEVDGQKIIIQRISTEIDLGQRAPVVLSVTPSGGDCSASQNLILSGSCFVRPDGTPNVTSVFAVDTSDPNNVVQARSFALLTSNLLDADIDFGSANAGRAFFVFVSGPSGTSRNLASLPPDAPPDCPSGNEAGIQVMFTCSAAPQTPRDAPVITSCSLERNPGGAFILRLTGENIRDGATITIDGGTARKVRFRQLDPGSETFRSVELKGRICKLLPGVIVVTNPGGEASEPFQCNAECN